MNSVNNPDTGATAALDKLLDALETKWAEYRQDGGCG